MSGYKGIILAGGIGSRLGPMTRAVSKQLLPVYDKPMIYYPLSTLMLAGVRDIQVITTPDDLHRFHELLGDGSQWGMSIGYAEQARPEGIAQALLICAKYIANDPVVLILGDNLFYGHGFPERLRAATARKTGATIFAYYVREPHRYGVVKFDQQQRPVDIIEKPQQPVSNYAVTGLYFYDADAVSFARSLKPSARGELEITDVNRRYLAEDRLDVQFLGRGIAWLDTGTHESLLEAANFIGTIEARQGLKVACPEEVAWRMGYIDDEALARAAAHCPDSAYSTYLRRLSSEQRTL